MDYLLYQLFGIYSVSFYYCTIQNMFVVFCDIFSVLTDALHIVLDRINHGITWTMYIAYILVAVCMRMRISMMRTGC